jgi:hypothetical protein
MMETLEDGPEWVGEDDGDGSGECCEKKKGKKKMRRRRGRKEDVMRRVDDWRRWRWRGVLPPMRREAKVPTARFLGPLPSATERKNAYQ